jgi:hypothetical protein
MIQKAGISINRKKVPGQDFSITADLLLHKKYLLVQKGKKELLPGESKLMQTLYCISGMVLMKRYLNILTFHS